MAMATKRIRRFLLQQQQDQQDQQEQEQHEEQRHAVQMTSTPWACLPHHLLTLIFARLPLLQALQLQTLSTFWRCVLRSPAYDQMRSLAVPSESWLVMHAPPRGRGEKKVIAYCPTSGRWFDPPLSVHAHPYPRLLCLTGAGGLICGFNLSEEALCINLLVYDFLKKTRKEIPLPFQLDSICEVERHDLKLHFLPTGSYLVVLDNPTQPNRYRNPHIYDSKTGCWGIGSGHFAGTVLDGDLFQLRKTKCGFTLAAYSAELDAWSKVKAPRPSCLFEGVKLNMIFETVIKCKGKLLLLAGLLKSWSVLLGFGVWELQIEHDTASWMEVARTPARYWKLDGSWGDYVLRFHLANESLICMTAVPCMLVLEEVEPCLPIVYDLALDSWHQLPPYKDDVHGLLGGIHITSQLESHTLMNSRIYSQVCDSLASWKICRFVFAKVCVYTNLLNCFVECCCWDLGIRC